MLPNYIHLRQQKIKVRFFGRTDPTLTALKLAEILMNIFYMKTGSASYRKLKKIWIKKVKKFQLRIRYEFP